jgi:hypothetical protein
MFGWWRVWRYRRYQAKLARFSDQLWRTEDPRRARYLIDRLKADHNGAIGYMFKAAQHRSELVRIEVARLGDPQVDTIFSCVLDDLLEDPSPRVVEETIRSLVAIAQVERIEKLYPAVMLLRHILREQPVPYGDAYHREREVDSLLNWLPALWWGAPRARALLPLLQNETRAQNIRRAMLAAAAIERIEKASARSPDRT